MSNGELIICACDGCGAKPVLTRWRIYARLCAKCRALSPLDAQAEAEEYRRELPRLFHWDAFDWRWLVLVIVALAIWGVLWGLYA